MSGALPLLADDQRRLITATKVVAVNGSAVDCADFNGLVHRCCAARWRPERKRLVFEVQRFASRVAAKRLAPPEVRPGVIPGPAEGGIEGVQGPALVPRKGFGCA